jgi:hypothetical protein
VGLEGDEAWLHSEGVGELPLGLFRDYMGFLGVGGGFALKVLVKVEVVVLG